MAGQLIAMKISQNSFHIIKQTLDMMDSRFLGRSVDVASTCLDHLMKTFEDSHLPWIQTVLAQYPSVVVSPSGRSAIIYVAFKECQDLKRLVDDHRLTLSDIVPVLRTLMDQKE